MNSMTTLAAPRLATLKRSPRRISITIPEHVFEALINRSLYEGRSISNLAAFLLEAVLLEGFSLSNKSPRPL
jgi:hypothetical protein